MPNPIQCTQGAFDFARRLNDAAQRIIDDLGLTGCDVIQGAAIYAGTVAKLNARPGSEAIVAMLSADIVNRLAAGYVLVN